MRSIDHLKYNQIRQISSHNSYDSNGPKGNVAAQYAMGTRSFEFDLHLSGNAGDWDVSHYGGHGDYVRTLRDGLAQLAALHAQHPGHDSITVWLELKDDWRSDGHSPTDLETAIQSLLPGVVYTPGALRAGKPPTTSLREVVDQSGWPTVSQLKDKFIFVTMGNDDAGAAYIASRQVQAMCFVAPEDDLEEKLARPTRTWAESVFFNCHNNDGAMVPREVYRRGYVSRIWRVDDQQEYDFAMGSLSHHIATDHVTEDLFIPRLVEDGRPFATFPTQL